MKALVNIATETALKAANEGAAAEVVSQFLQQLDCKESSRQIYGRTLRQFFKWVDMQGKDLNALTRADIIAYRDGLMNGTATADGKKKSPLTAAAYLTSLKLFYTWLEAMGIYNNITAGVKLPHRNNRYEKEPLNNRQARELVEEVKGTNLRDNAIINLLLRTGLRCVEVVRANVEDLQEKCGTAVLYVQGKGHDTKDNFVILSDKCRASLQSYLNTRADLQPEAPLFVSDSNNNKGGRMTTRAVSHIAKTNLQAIGLDSRSYTAHSLRHTCACSLLESTNDLNLVQLTLRHANIATTQIYTYHLNERRRIEAAAETQLDKIF